MRLHYSEKLRRDYAGAPLEIQRTFDRKIELLVTNLRHPSLHAKKYSEASDVWQARVTHGWRLYFKIEGDTYFLISLSAHPK
jgi:mRNA-degrading endonuclease RelE of RelBE toxin-antitoxin system